MAPWPVCATGALPHADEPELVDGVTRVAMDRRTFLRATGLSVAGVVGAGWAAEGPAPGGGPVAAQSGPTTIDELAASLDYDQERIFRFVADAIAYEPYAGVLRGPRTTLAGRAGNAADKAVLLAELMRASLIETRFVVGALDDATSDELARTTADPAAVRRRRALALAGGPRPTAEAPPPPEVQAIVDRLPDIDAAATSWASTTLDDSARTIVAALADAGITVPSAGDPLPALERTHHVWVQARSGPDWQDLDPTLQGAVQGLTVAVSDGRPSSTLPDDLRHRIDIEVVVERINGNALEHEVVMEHTLFADEAAGTAIALGHARPDGLKALGGALAQLLDGGVRYQPVLQVGDTSLIGTTGVLVSGGEGDVFDVGGSASRDGEATAEWIGFAITAPGGRTTNVRRVLFDRIGDEVRAAGTIDPAAIPVVELTPMGPDGSPEYPPLRAVHFVSIATGASARPTVSAMATSDEARTAAALGIPVAMYHVTRDTTNALLTLERGVAVHLDGPNLTMHSFVPVVSGDGSIRVRESIDLLHRSFGLLPVQGVEATAPAGILAGVASHVAERLRMGEGMPADLAASPSPVSPGAIIERAIADGTGLAVLRDRAPVDAAIPAPAMERLGHALADGWVAVGPQHPVTIDGEARLGWWLVHPATGATTDLLDDGRGVTLVEWATVVVVVAVAVVVAYACLGRASRAAAWNAWAAQMEQEAASLGVDVGPLSREDPSCF